MSLHDASLSEDFRECLEVRSISSPVGASKLLKLCENFWDALDSYPTVAASHADEFAKILSCDEHLLLARNVIPELRPGGSPTGLSEAKRELLRRVQRQQSLPNANSHPQSDEAGAQLAAEGGILDGANTFRACVSMCNRPGEDGILERHRLREWLDVCPIEKLPSEVPSRAHAHTFGDCPATPSGEDIYRISILVRGHYRFLGEAERLRIHEWLHTCPVHQTPVS
ncbi:hypothetical protein SLS60_007538 [Paraconiothyrium brasiliense]|uniref:Uncharacterized protein n=1 Tax=Paraconiothyrium brasiliense TaxID=300254 RepID=A0ABR3R5N2_9PLEO